MQLLDAMAAEGKAWPLLEGIGTIYGMFVVNSVSETRTEFFSTGSARRIEFTLTLTRVDESFTAMYGDLQAQAEGMLGQVSELAAKAGNMAGGVLQ
ncbi:Phage protein U [Serratia grimesii]|nr:Phage protein U [Serratia grimesii]